ncbi:hypothetical protein N9537_06905, partial [Porticoccaceae bacterium]|nr:hypothetical protein [Porticoccaceae bacterium]
MTVPPKINPPAKNTALDARYRRAEAILQGLRTQSLVQNDAIIPHWMPASSCLWYQSHKKAADPESTL